MVDALRPHRHARSARTVLAALVVIATVASPAAASSPRRAIASLDGPDGRAVGTEATAGPPLFVDAGRGRRPVSPLIYGVSFAEEASARTLGITLDRRGGNSTTRYSYDTGFHNTGADWYFENIPPGTATLPHHLFVQKDRRIGASSLLTMPLIGWTPRGDSPRAHPYACGFKRSKYGQQQDADWTWDPDCGNGVRPDGSRVTGNAPTDTSVAITADTVRRWVAGLVARYGRASAGGVRFYHLDNEPALWDSTHRDVHPAPLTYDELRRRTIAYASAIKTADPSAQVLGPGDWGWCAYFYSPADPGACSDGPDKAAHGNVALAPWYLAQLQAEHVRTGRRLLDVFDEHFYPQSGVALRTAGDASMRALRLRATRSLWDPTYKDESWISHLAPGGIAVQLIPRMRGWVAARYPGTRLAISEYNFGGLESVNGALAQADVLGILAREGVHLAALWGAEESWKPWAYAYRIYRNYDGAGSRWGETWVHSRSDDAARAGEDNGGQGRLSVYGAVRARDGALTVVVINKTRTALTSSLSVAGFTPRASAQVWRYSGASPRSIIRGSDAPVSSGRVRLTYPGDSITLLVLPGG